jgi:hypothetical protein
VDTLLNFINQSGLSPWLILFAALAIGIILLRIVFEIAEAVIQIGCAILFILIIGYILFTFFGS